MIIRSRLWLWLSLALLLALGVLRLRFDVAVLNLLPANAPAVQGLKLYQQNFSSARELISAAEIRQLAGPSITWSAVTTAGAFFILNLGGLPGLAQLGSLVGLGIALAAVVMWWLRFGGGSLPPSNARPRSELPSSLYRTDLWRLGHWAAANLSEPVARRLCYLLGAAYWALNARRREIVITNLLPGVAGDRAKAKALSRQLFRQFALKIADLWRYESGLPIEHLIHDLKGWDYFAAAQQRGRGILLLTPHLGNWEFGAPLLAARGIKLTVITLNEPQSALTELRKASRSRWGIETLVIGENPFAFVDVIRRLEAGGTIALLMDRPPASSSTPVQLFGRPFLASVAAAEMARASDCVLLPVFLPRLESGYRAEVLPEIAYDRAALGSRKAREQLTQEIMRVFEPVIQQHLDQWYHFVPVWKENP